MSTLIFGSQDGFFCNDAFRSKHFLYVVYLTICIPCIQCILGGNVHLTPTIVRINTYLRSIDKIDDYKMVSYQTLHPK